LDFTGYKRKGILSGAFKLLMAIIALVPALMVFQGAAIAQQATVTPGRVLLWAHRGLTSMAPENSLAAIKAAQRLGLKGCELDIRATADGHMVLMHDATVDRTTTGKGLVKEYSLHKFQGLFLLDNKRKPSNHFPPTLSQALELILSWPDFELTLDLKEADPIKAGRMVLDRGLSQRVTFFVGGADKVETALALRSISPKLRISLDPGWWWRVEGVPAFMIKSLQATDIFAAEWNFPARGFGEALKAGARVSVYLWGKKNLLARAKKALAMGAKGISCDHPRLLLPLLSSKLGPQ
jgi:glycerophosphoryl diester phosphodiesterase